MRPLLALVIILLCVGLTGPWWSTNPTALPPTSPRIACAGIVTLDPTQASSLDEFRVLGGLFEGLVRVDPQHLDVVAALAERWELAADQRTWTFHLGHRRWSDQTPVTAEQMVAGLRVHLAGSATSSLLAGIDAVQALDANTVVLHTRSPMPWLPSILATPVFIPLHAQHLAGRAWIDPQHLVTNGPLQCADFAPRHHLDLIPSPTYCGPLRAAGALRLQIIDNPGSAVRLYLDGQIDAILSLNSDTIGDLLRTGATDLHTCPAWGTEFYRIRQAGNRPDIPLAVRQALARSIDREALVRELQQGNGVPAMGLIPHGAPGYVALPPERAIPDLSAMTLPALELVVPANQPERLRVAEWLIDHWRRTLGIIVSVSALPSNLALSRTKALDYDLARGSLVGDYFDPAYFLACFRADSGMNRTGWSDSLFAELLDQAARADDQAQRYGLLARAEQRLLEQGVVVPLFHYSCNFLVRPTLGGIHANTLELVRLADIGWQTSATHAPALDQK